MATTTLNAKVSTATLESSRLDKGKVVKTKLYYLIIDTNTGQMQINIGEKTFNNLNELTKQK